MNIGLEIVSSIINEGKIAVVLEAGLNQSWLADNSSGSSVIFNGTDRQAFQWILNHWKKHHKVPTRELFEDNFPYASYKLSSTGISLDELVDMVVPRVNGYLVADLIGRTIDLHDENQIDKAIELLKIGSDKLANGIKFRQVSADNLSDPEYDIEDLLSRKIEFGIPFGIVPIDDKFYGFQPTQLISVLGRQKSGKTTIMLNSALNAWKEGYTVLFFSVEMDVDMLRQRLYCLGSHVSPSRMRRGHLRDSEKDKVREFHKELSNADEEEGRFFISKKRSYITVDEIREEIAAVNPHVIYIDGFDFLIDKTTRRSTTNWEANETVAGDLKTLAMDEGRTFVVATQVQEKQYHPKFGIEARTITGGTGLLKKSDLVIGLDKDENNLHTLSCVLSRYEYFDEAALDIDWDTMTLTVIEEPKRDLASIGV